MVSVSTSVGADSSETTVSSRPQWRRSKRSGGGALGIRDIGRVVAVLVLALFGVVSSVSSVATAGLTTAGAGGRSPSATDAPVVTNGLSGHWVVPHSAAVGTKVGAALGLTAVEPLHHVVVTITTKGPVSVKGGHVKTVGTLAAGQQSVALPVTMGGPGLGSVDASINGLNALGQPVSDQADLALASDQTSATFSTSGSLHAQEALLELRRSTLGNQGYNEAMDDLLGGGAEVQIVHSSETAEVARPQDNSMTTISGQIRYTAVDGSVHPARDVMVQIWDDDAPNNIINPNPGNPGTLLTTVWADNTGAYTATVSTFRSAAEGGVARQLYVDAVSEADTYVGGTGNGQVAFSVHAAGSTTPYYISSSVSPSSLSPVTVTATGAPVALNLTANNTAVNNTAFDVADALETGMQYTAHLDACSCLSKTLSYTQNLSIQFPDPDGLTQYDTNPTYMQVAQGNQFNFTIILHEYGHGIANQMGITQNPGGNHNLYSNASTNFTPPNKLEGMELAWGEGFATFFALMAIDYEKSYEMGIPTVEDGIVDIFGYDFNYLTGTGTRTTTAAPGAPSQILPFTGVGEDNEVSVGSALYQFYKGPSISLPDTTIISTLEKNGSSILSSALPPLMKAAGAATFDDSDDSVPNAVEHANDFACILSAQDVAPAMITPTSDSPIEPGTPPTFTWDPGGAGGLFPLDQFTVQFWDANWDKMVFQSTPQTGTSYTPSAVDWDQIMNATDAQGGLLSSLNVTVKGVSTPSSTPYATPTGPYKSCAITLDLDRQPADLSDPTLGGGSLFGTSVGLSSDGKTSIVGAPGDCLGIVDPSQGCGAGTVSFYTLDPNTDLWTQTQEFTPQSMGLTDCPGGVCSDAVDVGDSVAISGNGTTAAAAVSIDPDSTPANFGNNWELEVVTFALENGTWKMTGEPTLSQGNTAPYEPGQTQNLVPSEVVALDDVGNALLVGDPSYENLGLEAGSSQQNSYLSTGIAYSFTSAGNADPAGFTLASTIDDLNSDTFGTLTCTYLCTTWIDQFAGAIALSGNGLTATISDNQTYAEVDNPVEQTKDTVDLYKATTVGEWSSGATQVLTGSDVASSWSQDDTCSPQFCEPEDYGGALSISDDGQTVFVGDPTHDSGLGSVYVYTPASAGSPYKQVAELTSSDGDAVENLGSSLANADDGAVLLAGAPDSSNSPLVNSGAAELFTETPGGWVDGQQASDLTADDAANWNLFGNSVGISADGSETLIGSPGDVEYTAYPGGYDGEVYTLAGVTPTSLSLSVPDLTETPTGSLEGTTGQSATLTATVSPIPSGGTVAFSSPGGVIEPCSAVPVDPTTGVADCPITLPEQSTLNPVTSDDSPLTYSATYSGSGVYGASAPGTTMISVVSPLTITTTSLPTITAGVALTAGQVTMAAAGGVGNLTWSVVDDDDGTDNLPASMQLAQNGTFSGEIPTAGSYTFDVEVTDSSPVPQSAIESLTWVVVPPPPTGPPAPTVTLNPLVSATYGTATTASVVVSAAGGNPKAGDVVTVSVMGGTTVVATCTITLPGGSNDSSQCSLPGTLAAASYSVVATFQGAGSVVAGADPAYATTASSPQTLVVVPSPTVTTIAQLTPVAFGTPALISVGVSSSGGYTVTPPAGDKVAVAATASGASMPAATCTATLSGGGTDTGSCSLGSSLGIGSYTLSATYSGDTNFTTSTSTGTLSVEYGTTVTITAPTEGAALTAGASVTYTATVASSTAPSSPTGIVTFTSGTTGLCVDSSLVDGTASCTSSSAPVGSDTVTASFTSSAGFAPASGTTTVTVSIVAPTPPPGAVASASASGSGYPYPTASVPDITATGSGAGALTVASYGTQPLGTTAVTGGTGVFYDVAIGPGSTFNPLTIMVCDLGTSGNALDWWNGGAWLPFSNEVVDTGANAGCVTATVDSASSFSTTSPTTQEMTGTPIAVVDAATGDFSVAINPKNQNLGPNDSAGYSVTVGSTGGFAEPVALTVTGLPSGVTGRFSPPTVNPEGGSVISILTLTAGSTLTSSGGNFTVTGTYGTGPTAVVHSADDGSVTLNFELQPTCYGQIAGVVTDAQTNLPVAGATVTTDNYPPTQATTQSDGSFTLTNVELGANNGTTNTDVTVTARGYFTYASSSFVVSCGPTSTVDPVITEIETGNLTGHIYYGTTNPADPGGPGISTGVPLSGAGVTIEQYEPASGTDQPAADESAADGSYSFTDVPDGPANVPIEDQVSAQGPMVNPSDAPLGFWSASADPTISAGTTSTADMALVPVCSGGTITATVYSQDTGLPLDNATVSDGLGGEVTNANGVATFTNLEQGYNNSPRAYGFSAANQADTGFSQGVVETTLEACGDSSSVSLYIHVPVNNYGNLTGTVTNSVNNQPIPTAIVSLGDCGQGTVRQPNDLGQFSDSTILIGQDTYTSTTCYIYAQAPGYYPTQDTPVVIYAGLTSTVALTMLPQESATVTGTVTNELTGAPVPNVTVSGPLGTTTNALGQYTVSGNDLLGNDNASQTDQFSFYPPSTGVLQSGNGTVSVTAGQTSVLNIALYQACGPATVTGTVYNASNQAPISGAAVSSSGTNAVTDANGNFLLQIPTRSVSFETYITASANGFNPKTESIEIYCGAHIVLDFGQSSNETGTLTGTVTNAANNADVSGATVEANWGAVTTTNSSGVYTFDNVPLGNNNAAETWDVTVDPPSGSPLQPEIQSISVPGNTTTILNFALGYNRAPCTHGEQPVLRHPGEHQAHGRHSHRPPQWGHGYGYQRYRQRRTEGLRGSDRRTRRELHLHPGQRLLGYGHVHLHHHRRIRRPGPGHRVGPGGS